MQHAVVFFQVPPSSSLLVPLVSPPQTYCAQTEPEPTTNTSIKHILIICLHKNKCITIAVVLLKDFKNQLNGNCVVQAYFLGVLIIFLGVSQTWSWQIKTKTIKKKFMNWNEA